MGILTGEFTLAPTLWSYEYKPSSAGYGPCQPQFRVLKDHTLIEQRDEIWQEVKLSMIYAKQLCRFFFFYELGFVFIFILSALSSFFFFFHLRLGFPSFSFYYHRRSLRCQARAQRLNLQLQLWI